MRRCPRNYTKLRAGTQDKRRKSEISVLLCVDEYEVKCFLLNVRLPTATLCKKEATKLSETLNLFLMPLWCHVIQI